MYCSNCGAKIPNKGRFCPECGETTFSASKVIPEAKSGPVEVTLVPQKKKAKGGFIIVLIMAIFFFMIAYFGSISGSTNTSEIVAVFGFIASILAIWWVIWLIVLLVKFSIKKPKFIPAALAIVVIVILAPTLIYIYSVKSTNAQFLEASQSSAVDLFVLKLNGDDLMAGRATTPGVTMNGISERAKAISLQLYQLPVNGNLNDYKSVIEAWADKMVLAANNGTWMNLPATPDVFVASLSQEQAEAEIENSFDKIAILKDYGDWAIATNNREAMRYVFGQAETQLHWLSIMSNIALASNSSTSDKGFAFNTIESVQAKSGYSFHFTPVCRVTRNRAGQIITSDCWNRAQQALKQISKVSRNYSVGDPSATSTTWDDAWKGLNDVGNIEGQPQGGLGITPGEPIVNRNSPMVDDFINSCKARGGNPNPPSLVRTRLPTTEGGTNCALGNGCWESLTYTGRFFAGGNPGCPEVGLLPKPAPAPNPTPNPNPSPGPTPTPVVTSYDGTYSVKYSYGSCGTNMPVDLGNLGVYSDTLTVKNNYVSWGTGYSAKIDSNGRAVWSYNISGMGYIREVFNFTKTGVSGTFSFQVSAQGASVGCNGSFTGSKR